MNGTDGEKDWYRTWRQDICEGVHQLVKDKFGGGNPTDSNGVEFAQAFEAAISSTGVDTSAPEEEKKEEKPKAKAKEPAKKEERKREPKLNKDIKSIEALNYSGETLTFEGEDVTLSKAFNFIRSEKTNFVIKGKVKAVLGEGLKNCAIVVDNVVTAIELMNCQGVNVQITGKASQFITDRCEKTGLYLSEEGKGIKILTTNSITTVINFPANEEDENGNDTRSLPIFETWQTVIEGDNLSSAPLDLSE